MADENFFGSLYQPAKASLDYINVAGKLMFFLVHFGFSLPSPSQSTNIK